MKERANISYFPVFIIRRVVFLMLAFLMTEEPFYQIFIFIMTNLLFAAHTAYLQPFETKFYNHMVLLNEYFIIFVVCHLFCFTNILNQESQVSAGWSLCLFTSLQLLLNLLVIIYFALIFIMLFAIKTNNYGEYLIEIF